MINVNDFKTGMTISYDNNLYQVLEFQHVKPGKGAAIVKTKLKNTEILNFYLTVEEPVQSLNKHLTLVLKFPLLT